MRLYHQNENGEKVVSWTVYVWTIGVILIVFGIFGATNSASYARVTKLEDEIKLHNSTQQIDMIQIKVQLSQIQSDLAWLKKNASN